MYNFKGPYNHTLKPVNLYKDYCLNQIFVLNKCRHVVHLHIQQIRGRNTMYISTPTLISSVNNTSARSYKIQNRIYFFFRSVTL